MVLCVVTAAVLYAVLVAQDHVPDVVVHVAQWDVVVSVEAELSQAKTHTYRRGYMSSSVSIKVYIYKFN